MTVNDYIIVLVYRIGIGMYFQYIDWYWIGSLLLYWYIAIYTLLASRVEIHNKPCTQTYTQTDFADKSNFLKPGAPSTSRLAERLRKFSPVKIDKCQCAHFVVILLSS